MSFALLAVLLVLVALVAFLLLLPHDTGSRSVPLLRSPRQV